MSNVLFLYKTVYSNRKDEKGCKFSKVGATVNVPYGKYFITANSGEADQQALMDFRPGNILLELSVELGACRKEQGYYIFRKCKIEREWEIKEENYEKMLPFLSGGNLYYAGILWNISQKAREEAWVKLIGRQLRDAGAKWEGVTKAMVKEGWKRVEAWDLENAGNTWPHVTKVMKKEGLGRLNAEMLLYAVYTWKGINREDIKKAWKRLRGKALFEAGKTWENVSEVMLKEGIKRLKKEGFGNVKLTWK